MSMTVRRIDYDWGLTFRVSLLHKLTVFVKRLFRGENLFANGKHRTYEWLVYIDIALRGRAIKDWTSGTKQWSELEYLSWT